MHSSGGLLVQRVFNQHVQDLHLLISHEPYSNAFSCISASGQYRMFANMYIYIFWWSMCTEKLA